MAVVSPVYTDNVTILAAQSLTLGSTVRGVIDLRGNFGCYLFIKMARGGTTALTNSLVFRVSRVLNNDVAAAGHVHPVGQPLLASQLVAAASTTANAGAGANQPILTVSSAAGFAAGDIVSIQDAAGTFTRMEWQRVSKIAGSTLVMDRNLAFDHSGNADLVRNKADVFAPIWLAGGSLWEAVADYGAAGTGDTAIISVLGQTYTSESVV